MNNFFSAAAPAAITAAILIFLSGCGSSPAPEDDTLAMDSYLSSDRLENISGDYSAQPTTTEITAMTSDTKTASDSVSAATAKTARGTVKKQSPKTAAPPKTTVRAAAKATAKKTAAKKTTAKKTTAKVTTRRTVTTRAYAVGDVNHDGNIDIRDSTCLLNMISDGKNTSAVKHEADVNRDGVVNMDDVKQLVISFNYKGDINCDCKIDLADAQLLLSYIQNGKTSAIKSRGDINGDKTVDMTDYKLLTEYLRG